MAKKRSSIKTLPKRTRRGVTPKEVHKCPKCGNMTLVRDGFTPANHQRWGCYTQVDGKRNHCYTTTDPTAPFRRQSGLAGEPDKNPQFRRALSGIKRFVITGAQNATPIHKPFFDSLRHYCRINAAELIVIPMRYKNATSRWSQSQANAEVWAKEVQPYLYNQRKKLNDNLILMADIKTQPTAQKPLSGFEAISLGESAIFGHTKLQMTVVPTPQGKFPKLLTTTGACTIKNYTDTKAGKKGEFHHALAAVVVEIVGSKFFVRHINATADGSFIDLNQEYTPTGANLAPPALALVMGDTHRAFIDPKVEGATFDKGGMVDVLKPEHIVVHDLHDGYAENPYHFGNPFIAHAKQQVDMHRIRKEVEEDVEWICRVSNHGKVIVVPSNHDNFLWRWILKTDWRNSMENADFYLETALAMLRGTSMETHGTSTPDPFIYWVEKLVDNQFPVRCLKRDESVVFGGVEVGLHGDQGPNGARGSRQSLRRIGVKSIIGHSHTPGIEEGCYQCGTSTPMKLEYNEGPSSWLQAHCILYANGKRAILPIIDGLWCFDAAKVR